jgi:hypothetical protein
MNAAFRPAQERRIHAAEADLEEFCLTPGVDALGVRVLTPDDFLSILSAA